MSHNFAIHRLEFTANSKTLKIAKIKGKVYFSYFLERVIGLAKTTSSALVTARE